MQRKVLLKVILVLLLISGSFIVLWSSSNSRTANKPCTENMEECSKKNNNGNSGEMILESLSRQFFSTTEMSN